MQDFGWPNAQLYQLKGNGFRTPGREGKWGMRRVGTDGGEGGKGGRGEGGKGGTSSFSAINRHFKFADSARKTSYFREREDKIVLRISGSRSEIPTINNLLVISLKKKKLFKLT